MRLQGYSPAGSPVVSYLNHPSGSIVGSAERPIGRIISLPGLPGPPGADGGMSEATLAAEIANPESATNDAVINIVEGVLGGGVSGLMKVVDARENLAMARPTWAGELVWLINEGDSTPIHLADGDAVWEVSTEPLPWTPEYLTVAPVAWYDAQALTLSNGDAVATWPDLTAGGHDVVQATSGDQPSFASSGINSHPAVYFSAATKSLHVALASALTGSFTLYVVVKADGTDATQAQTVFGARTSAAGQNAMDLLRTSSEEYQLKIGSPTVSSSASAWNTTTPKLIKAVFSGASTVLEVDGVSVASGSLTVSNVKDLIIGNRGDLARGWVGHIGEVILANYVISGDDATNCFDYLNTRWDLGL